MHNPEETPSIVLSIPTESALDVRAELVDVGHGHPVLLLHDLGPFQGLGELRDLFEGLRGERPVVLPELGAAGASLEHVPASLEAHARRLASLVEELVAFVAARHGSTVDIVASGVMGKVARRAVRAAPRHVRSLVVLGAHVGVSVSRRVVGRALGVPLLLATHVARARGAESTCAALTAVRLRLSTVLDASTWGPMRTPFTTLPRREGALEALRAFWARLPSRPELRVIRGEGGSAPRAARPRVRALRTAREVGSRR